MCVALLVCLGRVLALESLALSDILRLVGNQEEVQSELATKHSVPFCGRGMSLVTLVVSGNSHHQYSTSKMSVHCRKGCFQEPLFENADKTKPTISRQMQRRCHGLFTLRGAPADPVDSIGRYMYISFIWERRPLFRHPPRCGNAPAAAAHISSCLHGSFARYWPWPRPAWLSHRP